MAPLPPSYSVNVAAPQQQLQRPSPPPPPILVEPTLNRRPAPSSNVPREQVEQRRPPFVAPPSYTVPPRHETQPSRFRAGVFDRQPGAPSPPVVQQRHHPHPQFYQQQHQQREVVPSPPLVMPQQQQQQQRRGGGFVHRQFPSAPSARSQAAAPPAHVYTGSFNSTTRRPVISTDEWDREIAEREAPSSSYESQVRQVLGNRRRQQPGQSPQVWAQEQQPAPYFPAGPIFYPVPVPPPPPLPLHFHHHHHYAGQRPQPYAPFGQPPPPPPHHQSRAVGSHFAIPPPPDFFTVFLNLYPRAAHLHFDIFDVIQFDFDEPRGLTEREIDNLETFRAQGAIQRSAEEEEEKCTICLDAYQSGVVCKVLRCKHIFHSECVTPWLKANTSCPVCRCEQSSR